MKFWVKAITDNNVQEQLLVNADNSEELIADLSCLLQTQVVRTSISDFQSQVIDRLQGGVDIIPVKVTTHKIGAVAASTGHAPSDGDAALLHSAPSLSDRSLSFRREEEDVLPPPPLRSQSVPDAHPPTPARALFDAPRVDRICLTRADAESLLHPHHDGAYHGVVGGSFVRVSEGSEYALYQVVRPLAPTELLLDMIHYHAARHTEVVSNAPPAAPEVKAWARKVVAASRPFPSDGFVEAKAGDVDSALRAVNSKSEETTIATPSPYLLSVQTLTGHPPTPPSDGKRRQQQQQWWRRRTMPAVPQRMPNNRPPGESRMSLKINDTLLYPQVTFVESPEGGESEMTLFATRCANYGKKKPRLSDFSGCMLKLGKGVGILADRDVTEKGYEMFSPPQRWDCHYVALGQIRPSVGDAPYFDSSNNFVQDFTVLSGRFLTGLFNPPTTTALPIPIWAQGEGMSVQVIRPQLVVHLDKMHVFYLLRLASSVQQTNQSDQQQQNLSSNWYVSPNYVVDKCDNNDSLNATTSDHNPGANSHLEVNGVQSSSNTAFPPSLTCSFDFSGAEHCTYNLAHAVSCDAKLHSWCLVSSEEPLRSCVNNIPVFTVTSVVPPDVGRDPDGNLPARQLQLLWFEEERAVSARRRFSSCRRANSTCSSPSQVSLTGRSSLPFERWVNTHTDSAPEEWTRGPLYAANRTDTEMMRQGVVGLSLYEQEGFLYAAIAQMEAHQRESITCVPVTAEM